MRSERRPYVHRETGNARRGSRGTQTAVLLEALERRDLLSTFYVSGNDPAANDNNAGTSITAPLKTISRALSLARNNNSASQADTILIRGGVYREQLNIWTTNSGSSENDRTVISAYADPVTGAHEDVFVMASDVATGVWTRDGDTDRWYLSGFTAQTSAVFVDWIASNDGPALQQIGGYAGESAATRVIMGSGVDDMVPGSYFGDAANGRLYVWLADSSDPNEHQISYAARPHVVYQPGTALPGGGYSYAQHLDIKGLKLRHTNAYMPNGQDNYVAIYTANNQRLYDLDVQWNSNVGVILRDTGQMFDCICSNNGGNGVAAQGRGFLIDGGQFNRNFWRQYNTGSAAGIKVITNTPDLWGDIINIEAAYNRGIGVWYDTDYFNTVGNVVANNYIHDNGGTGLFLEASRNFLVRNNIIAGNTGAGISLNAVENAGIFNNTIVGNYGNAAIELNGGTRENSVNWGGGVTGLRDITIRNNIIADNYTTFDITMAQLTSNPLVTGNTSDYNLIYRRGGDLQLSRGGTYQGSWGPLYTDLGNWQAASGQDVHSIQADPRFVGGSGASAYRLGSDSPAIGMGVNLIEVPSDRDGVPRPTGEATDAGAYEFAAGSTGVVGPVYLNPDATVWIDDSLPAGSSPTNPDSTGNTGVNRFWYYTDQSTASGLVAVDSRNSAAPHRHYVQNLPPRTIGSNDVLYAWVWLDPQSIPEEVMLEYKDASGSWEHRAYWGANHLAQGIDGKASRRAMGPLPAAGTWTRLSVPAADLGLVGVTVTGMSLYLSNGRSLLDRVGSSAEPTIVAATAESSLVTGDSVALHAVADSPAGESNLVYTWSLVSGPAPVAFTINGSHDAGTTTATFAAPGAYQFQVTAGHDASGLVATSQIVEVMVVASATSIAVTPADRPVVKSGSSAQFIATVFDQFGAAMAATINWSATGGAINSSGLFAPGNTSGTFQVTAETGSLSASVPVTVDASIFTAAGNIGAVGLSGSVQSVSNGVYTITGSGADIGGTADSFFYTWIPVSGDVQIVARVLGMSNTNAYAKAGVMIRESVNANSRNAATLLTYSKGAYFQRRTSTGSSTSTNSVSAARPYWVKLVRIGDSFLSYVSSNGQNWTKVGKNISVTMGATAYVGLALTSRNNALLNTTTFDNVSITPVLPISIGSMATASSTASGSSTANAVDGNLNTTWSSATGGSQTLTIDLGQPRSIARVTLNWAAAYARSFSIQTSSNKSTWSTVYSTTTAGGQDVSLSGLNVTARYVRLSLNATAFSNYSIREWSIWGH